MVYTSHRPLFLPKRTSNIDLVISQRFSFSDFPSAIFPLDRHGLPGYVGQLEATKLLLDKGARADLAAR